MTSKSARACVRGAALALLLAASAAAPAQQVPQDEDPLVAAARASSAAGDVAAARRLLLEALALRPASVEAHGALLRIDSADPDARFLWRLRAAAACGDAKGKFRAPADWPATAPEEWAAAQRIAARRATAWAAVEAAAERLSGPRHVGALAWLEGLAREVEDGAPALAARHDEAFDAARARTRPDSRVVLACLLRVAAGSLKDDPGAALRAARLVRGMAGRQAQLGETADSDLASAAAQIADRARSALSAARGPAPSLAELSAVADEDAPAWNEAHSDWSAPGETTSPQGRYRVETTCGLRTLLALARVADQAHEIVAAWEGADPFEGRAGVIRACPSDAELDCEGAPFWWAAGFQSGDVTTLSARFPTPGAFPSLLVHELTHRFDHELHGPLPAWLLEGRATFLQTACGGASSIEETVVDWGRIHVARRLFAGRETLEKLLRGTVEDYRVHYDLGYALWTFLLRFRGFHDDEPPPFAPRLAGYLASFRASPATDPVRRFEDAFCGDAGARPASLEEFVATFSRFLDELTTSKTPWTALRVAWSSPPRRQRAPFAVGGPIYDAPCWDRRRDRHDPSPPGEDLARAAARPLLDFGETAAAVQAAGWALLEDEPDPAAFRDAERLFEDAGDREAAWFVRAAAGRGDEQAAPASAAAACAAVRALAADYAALAADFESRGRPLVADALRADHDRMAARVPGLARLGPRTAVDPPRPAPPREPELEPGLNLVAAGLVEGRWAPFDTRSSRLRQTIDGETLELGREAKAGPVSGSVRASPWARVGVAATPWLGGDYVVRTRVRFLSPYVQAAIVVGRQGADRGVELRFSARDASYEEGRTERIAIDRVDLALSDLRRWDVRTQAAGRDAVLATPGDSFDLEVRVAGCFVRAFVDGVCVATMRRVTGWDVEGQIGFAAEWGVVRFERPVVRRLRALGPDRASPEEVGDEPLSFDRASSFPLESAVGRRVVGPRVEPRGALLVWCPTGALRAESAAELASSVRRLRLATSSTPPSVVVAVAPDAETAESAPVLEAELAAAGATEGVEVFAHAADVACAPAAARGLRASPVWFEIDDGGVVRSATRGPFRALTSLFRALQGR